LTLITKNKDLNAYFLIPFYVLITYGFLFALFSWGNWRLVSDAYFGSAIVAINICWVSLSRNLKKEKKEQRKNKDRIGVAFLFYTGYSMMASFLVSSFL
jgi:hypothetical protein